MPIVGLDIPINLVLFIGLELLYMHEFHGFILPFTLLLRSYSLTPGRTWLIYSFILNGTNCESTPGL